MVFIIANLLKCLLCIMYYVNLSIQCIYEDRLGYAALFKKQTSHGLMNTKAYFSLIYFKEAGGRLCSPCRDPH